MNTIHPYGKIKYECWLPVYAHRTCKKNNISLICSQPNYEILFREKDIDSENNEWIPANPPFLVRNKTTKNMILPTFEYYSLTDNGETIKYAQTHLAVASAFPDVPPLETIDHIDNDPSNNTITNLVWLDRSCNSRKGQIKSVENAKKNGGKNGRFILMKQPPQDNKNNRKESITIGLFKNMDKCAQFIIDKIIQKNEKPQLKTVAAKISRAISIPEYKAYGFYFDDYEIKIDNEEWKFHPIYTKYAISTHGRCKNSHGIISYEYKSRNGAKYTSIHIEKSHKYIHRLVWETFIGEIPEGLDIMHDDTAPLYEDGSYRNWLIDLSLGTRSENMKSFHNEKVVVVEKITNPKPQEKIEEEKIYCARSYPKNILGDLMKNPPLGIQYIQAKNRGSKYLLSRRFSITSKDISTPEKKSITDEEKFILILEIYKKNCIIEKQDKKYMELDIDSLKQYIPLKN
jgi:hypothetical protein